MSSDIERLRRETSLSNLALGFGVQIRKDGQEWVGCCPLHQEETPSFTIFTGKDGVERFHCFGCGERGDVVDFVEKIKGVGKRDAIKILGGEVERPNIKRRHVEARDPYAGIAPVASDHELRPGVRVRVYNPKRAGSDREWGTISPAMVFPYRRADGALVGYVLRHDLPGGKKETPMVMWCRLTDGKESWCRYPFPKPRTLYGLEALPAAGQVIIVEGEKCRDRLQALMPNRTVLTWPGGTYGVEHTDWSPLSGRSVVIWPDADAPGVATGERIAEIIADLDGTPRVLDVMGQQVAEGWDVADAIDDGWSAAQVEGFMRQTVRAWTREAAPPPAADEAPPAASSPAEDEGRFPPIEAYTGEVVDLVEVTREDRPAPSGEGKVKRDGVSIWGDCQDALKEWAFLAGEAVFCNARTGEKMSKTAFDLCMAPVTPIVQTTDAEGQTKVKRYPPSKTLIEFLDGVVVSSLMYRPDIPDLVVGREGIRYLNSYLPSTVPSAAAEWKDHPAWQVVRDHIHNILPDGADLVIKWWAHNVRFPGRKILWSPIIVGVQGDGKTSIGKMGQAAMGARNVQPVSAESVFSDYTGWAEGSAVRILEEIRIHGNNRSTVMDKLKPFITNDCADVVRKGQDGKTIVNVTNYMALSNHMDALAIDEGDRRWGVWRTRFKNRDQMRQETGPEYWKKLHQALDGHPEVIRAWLLSIDLSDFDRFDAPAMNDAKQAMIDASRSPIAADIREAISLGGAGIGETVIATDCLNARARDMGGRAINTTTMSNVLSDLGWTMHKPTVKWRAKSRRVYYRADAFDAGIEAKDLTPLLRARLDDTDRDGELDLGYGRERQVDPAFAGRGLEGW